MHFASLLIFASVGNQYGLNNDNSTVDMLPYAQERTTSLIYTSDSLQIAKNDFNTVLYVH